MILVIIKKLNNNCLNKINMIILFKFKNIPKDIIFNINDYLKYLHKQNIKKVIIYNKVLKDIPKVQENYNSKPYIILNSNLNYKNLIYIKFKYKIKNKNSYCISYIKKKNKNKFKKYYKL